MKKFLLFCMASALTMSASAQNEFAVRSILPQETPTVKVKNAVKVNESKQVNKDIMLQTCLDENGRTFKRLVTNKVAAKAKAPAKAEGGTLVEDFESGSLPEGWTVVSKAEENPNPWDVVTPFSFFGDPQHHGDFACEVALSEDYCDEWLITPSFTVNPDEQLVFLGMIDLFFMLDYNYLDWATGEYSEKVPTAVLKIWATEDGENWTLVKDYFEQAASMTYDELMDDYMVNGGLYAKRVVSLGDFAGKTIQLGFQYVGTNGNNVGIDYISLQKPQMECNYEFPLWTPFFGISRDLLGLGLSIPVLPVYQPITWTAQYDKSIKGASAYWWYYNADSELDIALGDELTTSYVTDYSSEFNARNNLYYPPTLLVGADGWSDGECKRYDYFQVGGRPDWANGDKIIALGLSAYDPHAEGHTNANGPGGIPVFGTGEGVDDFWSRQLGTEGYLTAVSNLCYTPEYPIAFREAYTQAKASGIDPDATYTLEIRPVSDDGGIYPAVYSATLKGSDAYIGLDQGSSLYYTFNFDFGQTIVLDKESIGADRYMIVWGGLHNSAESLAPMQSYWESQKGFNHGYLWLQTADGESGALAPMNAFTGVNQGFGIMIDGWYPWLEAEEDAKKFGLSAGEEINIALDSYYPASELKVEASKGLSVSVAGAKNETVATVKNTNLDGDGQVVLSAPGVSLTLDVYSGGSGIQHIETTDAAPAEIYNLHGVKTNADASGVYVVKMNDGTIKKVVK